MAEEPLLDAAGRIADGHVVDWPAVTTTTSSPGDRELVDELALVARIAEGHRRLHQLLPAPDHRGDVNRARWGHLDLLDVVGKGSYGTVYRAWDPQLERLVALKLFHRAPDPDVVMREGRMLARVRHEHVVTVFGADVFEGVAGLWMEFVHGQTLDQIVRERGPLPPREAAAIGQHVARALGAIHRAQLLHCDVKAQNVVREATGRVVLMDLGAGRPIPKDTDRIGEVTGTPRYMAPELFQAGTPAARSTDVYALGVLLYYLVSGRFPVDAPSYQDLKRAHRERTFTPLEQGPAAYVSLVHRALDPDPAARPDSPDQIADALAALAAPPRRWLPPWAAAAALGVTLAIGGAAYFSAAPPAATENAAARRSIAVLPIRNLTGDDAKAYLAQGLTEVLIANLARVRAFRVPSLVAVAGFGQDVGTPAETASRLGVDWLLTGSVTQADAQFRMAVQLIDPATGAAIWGEEIVREAPGMLSAQAEIARFVAGRLALTLGGEEQQALAVRPIDPRAQDAYLRGLAVRAIPTARRDAARWFRLATEIDPAFAAAWADLALVEVVLHSDLPLESRLKRSAVVREMAERALGLDPTLAAGYAALGTVRFYDEWDFAGAEASFRQALAVDPSHAFTRQRFSMLLAALGRLDEAVATAREAALLEPLVPSRAIALGGVAYYARDFDLAEAEARRALQLSPDFPTALFLLGQIATARGRYDEAAAFVQRALAGSDHVGWLAELARISALAGRADDTRRWLDQLDARRAAGDAASPDNRAYLAIAQGRLEEAFGILDAAIDALTPNVLWLGVDPRVDPLRRDPRFEQALKTMGVRH